MQWFVPTRVAYTDTVYKWFRRRTSSSIRFEPLVSGMSTAVPRQVDSAKKTCRIITLLQERGPVGVTELATELGISKSTVHGHLATLTDTGLVVKEDHAYRLSSSF